MILQPLRQVHPVLVVAFANIIMVIKYMAFFEADDFLGGKSAKFDEVAADVIVIFHR